MNLNFSKEKKKRVKNSCSCETSAMKRQETKDVTVHIIPLPL